MNLSFAKESAFARFISPNGEETENTIEIRINPISGRTSRIAYGRASENEPGTETLPSPPPNAQDTQNCPFCKPQVMLKTPRMISDLLPKGRLIRNDSVLFPNLFPYGVYSAVCLFDNNHFIEIGNASLSSYADCFMNCAEYLDLILRHDPEAVHMAITQNHLPSAGGSLVHPHLQINADRAASNHHRFLRNRAEKYFRENGEHLFTAYLAHEINEGVRYIGKTDSWEWVAAFAPEGFYEIWGILPGITSLKQITDADWKALSGGVLNTQRFYRNLCRNGYNLGILFEEDGTDYLELRVVILARSNYAPWVRNDHTGFEVMLGDMATFTSPENTAENARPFWS